MAKDRVPGTYKSTATFEAKGRDKAYRDTKVEDEGYKYTTPDFPGLMETGGGLKRGEAMHVMHKPLTSARTQT